MEMSMPVRKKGAMQRLLEIIDQWVELYRLEPGLTTQEQKAIRAPLSPRKEEPKADVLSPQAHEGLFRVLNAKRKSEVAPMKLGSKPPMRVEEAPMKLKSKPPVLGEEARNARQAIVVASKASTADKKKDAGNIVAQFATGVEDAVHMIDPFLESFALETTVSKNVDTRSTRPLIATSQQLPSTAVGVFFCPEIDPSSCPAASETAVPTSPSVPEPHVSVHSFAAACHHGMRSDEIVTF